MVLGAATGGPAAAVELAAAGAAGLVILDAVEDRAAKLAAMLSRTFGAAAAAVAWRTPGRSRRRPQFLLSAADAADGPGEAAVAVAR